VTPFPALDRRLPPLAVAVIAAVCAAVFLAGSAVAVTRDGSPARKRAAAPTAPTPSPTASPTPSPTPSPKPTRKPVPKPKKLADYIVALDEEMPEYIQLPEGKSATVSLEQAAKLGDGKASAREKRVLTELGFVQGHLRMWEGNDDRLVVLSLFEWKRAESATTWVLGLRSVRQERRQAWTPKTPSSAGGCEKIEGKILDSIVIAVGRRTYSLAIARDGNCRTHAEISKIGKLVYDYARKLPK
jgi:hypothetical protein